MTKSNKATAHTALMFARCVQTDETIGLLNIVEDFLETTLNHRALVQVARAFAKRNTPLDDDAKALESMEQYKIAARKAARDCAEIAAAAAVLLGEGLSNNGLDDRAEFYVKKARYYIQKANEAYA